MKRLFDDPDMPAELRTDLLRSRHAGRDYDALAKLPELRSALSDASRPSVDAPTSADPSPFAWPRLHAAPWTWKIALIAAIGGGALVFAWPEPHAEPAQRPAVMPPPTAAIGLPPLEPDEGAVAAAPIEAEAPAPKPPRPVVASSRREIDQLERIRATLERDPAAAYRLAQRSEQEFPNGMLREERQALEVLALAKSGEADAAARRARQFFARYPQSPLRELLESALQP